MGIEIIEIGVEDLPQYSRIPIAFRVESRFAANLLSSGIRGVELFEEKNFPPYTKNYDGYADGRPERWPLRFDTDNWGFFAARRDDRWIGGAVVAYDTPGLFILAERRDLAVLWDLRVHPDVRREGVGTGLFEHAVEWARKRGCKQLKVETQNVNVPACRFYLKQGCVLGGIDLFGYRAEPEIGDEVMFLFYLDI